MVKFLNIFIMLTVFLQTLPAFSAQKKLLVNVPVTRIFAPFSTPNVPKYMKSAIIDIPHNNVGEVQKIFNDTENLYHYLKIKSELLFGEEVESSDFDKNKSYCLCSYKPLDPYKEELIYTADLIESSDYHRTSKPHPILVTVQPFASLEKGRDSIFVSMGTKLKTVGDSDIEAYASGFKISKEQRDLYKTQGRYYLIFSTDQSTGSINEKDVVDIDDLRQLEDTEKRARIIQQARLLLEQPYLWGGKSAFEGHGYDCAALVQIAYLTGAGKDIPRAVFDQAAESKEISYADLKPGDLLFTLLHANPSYPAPIHVMIWAGNNMLIEASPISMTVRQATVEEVFGLSFDDIKNGQQFITEGETRSVKFGRFL